MEDSSLCASTFYQREGGSVCSKFILYLVKFFKKSFFCDLQRESKSIRTNGLFLRVQDVVSEKCVVNFNQTAYT